MKERLRLYYDEEGDFLEITAGKLTRGYFRDLGKVYLKELMKKQEKSEALLSLTSKRGHRNRNQST